MNRLKIPKELAEKCLSQSELRAIRKNNNTYQSFTHYDILRQRYYHRDKKIREEDYSNGDKIKLGTHGPELKNGKLYISIYHYLEYVCKEPNEYKTIELGGYLTEQSIMTLSKLNPQYISCEYYNYHHKINKFELEFLRKKEKSEIFEKYRK